MEQKIIKFGTDGSNGKIFSDYYNIFAWIFSNFCIFIIIRLSFYIFTFFHIVTFFYIFTFFTFLHFLFDFFIFVLFLDFFYIFGAYLVFLVFFFNFWSIFRHFFFKISKILCRVDTFSLIFIFVANATRKEVVSGLPKVVQQINSSIV